jgi:hypothetical protein
MGEKESAIKLGTFSHVTIALAYVVLYWGHFFVNFALENRGCDELSTA